MKVLLLILIKNYRWLGIQVGKIEGFFFFFFPLEMWLEFP